MNSLRLDKLGLALSGRLQEIFRTSSRHVGARGARRVRGSWMKRAMDLAQMAFGQMGVNLGGRDIAVAEHLLHRAQIGAAFEQMSRKAVAQGVGTHPAQTAIVRSPTLESLEERLPRHRLAEAADEDRRVGPPVEQMLSRRARRCFFVARIAGRLA